jgi:hypothetical protein
MSYNHLIYGSYKYEAPLEPPLEPLDPKQDCDSCHQAMEYDLYFDKFYCTNCKQWSSLFIPNEDGWWEEYYRNHGYDN